MPDPLIPAGFLTQAFREGQSTSQALDTYREAGGSIRTQTWYRLAGEVRNAMANREPLAGLDPTLLPRDEHFTPWSAGSAGTYLYHVELPYRDTDTGEVFRGMWSIVTDRIMSPQDAIDEAIDTYSDNAARYGQVILGGVLAGLYAMGA